MFDFTAISWWQYAILWSVVAAIYYGMNGFYRLCGTNLVFWRSLGAVTILAPFMLWIQWPYDPEFYAYVIASSVLLAVADIILFDCIATYGGAVVTRVMSLRVWILFLSWSILVPSSVLYLLDPPIRLVGVIMTLGIGVLAVMKMRGVHVIRTMIPAIILFVAGDVLLKFALESQPHLSAIFVLTFIAASIMAVSAAVYMAINGTDFVINRTMLKVAGCYGAILFLGVSLLKACSFVQALNPAYPQVIAMTATLWIYCFHKYKNMPDDTNILAGFLLVISAVILILLTA